MLKTKMFYLYLTIFSLIIFLCGFFSGQIFFRPFPMFPPHHFGMHGRFPFMPKHNNENDMREMIARELDLSNDQQVKLDNIMEKYHPQIENHIMEMRKVIDIDRQRIDKEIEDILTPEQKKKFAAMRKGPDMPPGPPGGM
jgi:Spy/CpxP family protein refolding chaperone